MDTQIIELIEQLLDLLKEQEDKVVPPQDEWPYSEYPHIKSLPTGCAGYWGQICYCTGACRRPQYNQPSYPPFTIT